MNHDCDRVALRLHFREGDLHRHLARWRMLAWAAILIGVILAVEGFYLNGRANDARDEAQAERQTAEDLRAEVRHAEGAAEESNRLRQAAEDALAEHRSADGDFTARIGRAETALASCQDARRRDADRLAAYRDDVAVLRDRLGWLQRDVEAAKCATDRCERGSSACDPTTIDFGGRRR